MTAALDRSRSAEAERARLRADVALAARIVAPAWPLETFIAVNPLGGLEDRPFAEAIEVAGDVLGARGTLDEPAFRALHAEGRITDEDLLAALQRLRPDLRGNEAAVLADLHGGEPAPPPVRTALTSAEVRDPGAARLIDEQLARWLAAFLDGGQAAWPMPGRERGFFAAWRDLAHHDRTLDRAVRDRLRVVPERADDAALAALAALAVAEPARRAYVEAHLSAQPGWAGHVRWRAEHGERGIDLVDLLAVRLSYEAALLADAPYAEWTAPAPAPVPSGHPMERLSARERPLVWLAAHEHHVREDLLMRIDANVVPAEGAAPSPRPAAQLVCCIDVRSEGLRRHLEETGPYETLGFAGFFAVAIRFQELEGGRPTALCPVLLEPHAAVQERALDGAGARRVAGRDALAAAEDGFHAAKDDLVAPFALAEAAGWAAGPLAAAKTLAPEAYGALRARLQRRAVPEARTFLDVERAFPFEERALFAEVALRMMGLAGGFARLVVLCGHGSTTENNPYAAALDCGACGGNRGGPNARVAAIILNGPDVRAHLRTRGIEIPDDTVFVAAEHDTATDEVALLDLHLVPDTHAGDLDGLRADLATAGDALREERAADLPGGDPRARSSDWAQVLPEWGLAGNAAFVVGPRALTRGVTLGRRAFLHSYEAAADPDGSGLETILTAPLVVAQWINCQYYFSTVEPGVLGAGTKTIHNVVGGVGVLAGQDGDLKVGLPWQSVADGTRLVHDPVRLLAAVQAPLDRIDGIVERNPILQRLFGNDWVALAARDTTGDPWQRWTTEGWQPWRAGR